MTRLILRRVLALVPLLLIVTAIIFSLVLITPGDPARAILGEDASQEQVDRVRAALGLDDSIPVQYWRWLNGVVRGDLGQSLFSSTSVADAVLQRLPVTLSLAGLAVLFAALVGIPAGIYAGRRAGTWRDQALTGLVSVGVAVPNYWLGMMLVFGFSLALGWFPATGYVPFGESPTEWLRHLVLPAIALGAAAAAEVTRQLRGSLSDVLEMDYVRTARAKGLRERSVIDKHALKNAFVPVVTVLGLQLTRLIGATVIVEQVFALPGLGQLAITSVLRRDLPMIQGITLVMVLVAVLANLAVDLSYLYFNPKMRQEA